ncbi:MAG: Uma2 family endonuclease [Spirosomataceae bacterium]
MTVLQLQKPSYLSDETLSRTIELGRFIRSEEDFYQFCLDNDHLKIERNADGTIKIMALTGGKTGEKNSELNAELVFWKRKNGGRVFDSSTGFRLDNGATRSPDAAWIKEERWSALTGEQQEKHPPIAPDFVIELMSVSDDLKESQQKMQEYIENGVQLAWLIASKTEEIFIYRADGTVTKHVGFSGTLTGEAILEGFTFDLTLLK